MAEHVIDGLAHGSATRRTSPRFPVPLSEAEQRCRELLDALPAAIYTTDAAGRITFYNQTAAMLAGRRPEIGVDMWCVSWRLYTPDGTLLPHDQCPMAIALKENRPVRGAEIVVERPDGTRRPFIPYPTPLRDEAGRLIGAVNMLVDISERKQAEANRKLLLDELNHRVKNNMQMLHALLKVAERETASAEARGVLVDASRRVGAMVAAQQVLYASGPMHFSARDFIAAQCDSARQAFAKDICVVCDTADDELSNDSAMPLALILNELLTNAVKHGARGRSDAAIRVGLARRGGSFELTVEDDGPGFAPGAVPAGQAARRASGLGLVTGLARQLGGDFAVERGVGARCTVRFPP
jgi:PAS domain S-box-containing protein